MEAVSVADISKKRDWGMGAVVLWEQRDAGGSVDGKEPGGGKLTSEGCPRSGGLSCRRGASLRSRRQAGGCGCGWHRGT